MTQPLPTAAPIPRHAASPRLANPSGETQIHSSHLPQILRALGALAIVGSGLIYMLQGLYHSDADLRNWVYIALMFVLGLGGIFSFKMMQDDKGARLFFALGTLLVPVQFSQLGGLVLNYVTGEQNYLHLFTVTTPALNTLVLLGSVSLCMGLLMSYAGFAALNRTNAKTLCAVFLAMNLMLLMPLRDALYTLILLGAVGGLSLLLENRIFHRSALFATAEGLAARLICLLPIAIISTRGAFHHSDFFGTCLLLANASFVSAYTANCRAPIDSRAAQHWLRELLLFVSFAAALVALPGMSYELFDGHQALWSLGRPLTHFAYVLPVFIFALYLSHQARAGAPIYKSVAIFSLTLAALATTDTSSAAASVLLMAMSLVLAVSGFIQRQKISFGTGVLITALAIFDLVFAALRDISVNLWLVLALCGLFLVTLSSVLEKHGRRWLAGGRELWQDFTLWQGEGERPSVK